MVNKVGKCDNIIYYEKRLKIMTENEHSDNENNTREHTEIGKKSDSSWKQYIGIIGGILGILTTLFVAYKAIISPIISNKKDIEELQTNITSIKSDIDKGIDTINKKLDKFDDRIDNLLEKIYLSDNSSSNNHSSQAIPVTFLNAYLPTFNDNILLEPKWTSSDEKVAKILGSNNIELEVGELQNRKLVTTYIQEGNEVYFFGKYNENNHWDGECILNVYKNNELLAILEGTYLDGKLKNYKRIACDKDGEWTVTDRTYHYNDTDDYTNGETWNYVKTNPISQKINPESFDETDILKVDQVLNNIDKQIISYYKGEISNGIYSDQTENAYLVNYDEHGNIFYLYKGKVENGNANDDTGNAWSISLGYENDGYYYYKGNFKNGKREYTPDDWQPITQEEMKMLIRKIEINAPLTGLVND